MKPPKRVGIIGKEKAPALQMAADLSTWLQQRQIEVVVDTELAALAGLSPGISRTQIPSRVDLILVLGGEETTTT